MGKQHILFAALAILTFSCEQPVPRTDSASGFYDVSAYLQKQKNYLRQTQPKLEKTVQTGDKAAETTEITQTDWEDELAIFEEADLRKPSLRDYYTRQEEALPDGGITIRYEKIKDIETPIQYLRLQLTPARTLQHLEASFLEKNALFYSNRTASLSVDSASGNISSYQIEGVQKLIFSDSLRYAIKANL